MKIYGPQLGKPTRSNPALFLTAAGFVLCILLVAMPAYAYVDPNAAGLISQILTPLLIAGAAALTFLRKQIGAVFSSLSRRLRGRTDA